MEPPPHAVSQQTPSTQFPLVHSRPAVHTTPSGFLAAHSVPEQYVPMGQPAEHGIGQSTLVPLQVTEPPQTGSPGSPIGDGRHVPGDGGRSQRSQLPVHGDEQQTPFAHVPEVHWNPAVQVWPRPRVG